MNKTEAHSMPAKKAPARNDRDEKFEAALKASMRENRELLKELEAL